MTKAQRVVVLIGFVLVAAMLFVPPWKDHMRGGYLTRSPYSVGYRPIFRPPSEFATIDFQRLAIQCLLVAVLTGGVVFAIQPRRKD